MKTYLDCIPCFFRQALEASRIAGADQKTQKDILDKLAKTLPDFSLNASPPEMGRIIYRLVREMTGNDDPYKDIKAESNRASLGIYDELKRKVGRSRDRLLTAIELAIAGNIIDYGVKNSLDVYKEVERILTIENDSIRKEDKKRFDFHEFKHALKGAKSILYLGDNAGETVFDRILIEEIMYMHKDKKVIYAVKERPVINDALFEDVKDCGIDKIAEVVSTGLDSPGTILRLCSKEFLAIFKKADMIISKGQGNFEALSDSKRPVFFLFMAKCPMVAKELGCCMGDVLLLYLKGLENGN